MSRKYKILTTLLSLFSVVFLSSCKDSGIEIRNSLSKIVDNKFDYIEKEDNLEVKRTEKILNDLLDKVFADNIIQKTEFLNNQNNKNYQNEQLKKLKFMFEQCQNEIGLISDPNEQKKKEIEFYEKNIFPFYSENWYFILKNLNIFYVHFYDWLTIPENQDLNSSHSEEFLESLKNLKLPDDAWLTSSLLDKLEEGEESAESYSNYIFYLSKGKIIFRIKIDKNSTKNNKLEIEPWIWYFSFSKTNNISIKLISNILHSAYVHGDQIGYDRFESDLVKKLRYGVPSKIILKIKDNYEI